MNANQLKDHLREMMRGATDDLAAHLREVHGLTGDLPKTKQALVKLHASQDHSETRDAETERNASVLAGVTRPKDEAPAANEPKAKPAAKAPAKPATRTRPAAKAPAKAAPKPATPKPAAKTSPKAPARKAPAAKPAPKPEEKAPAANGTSPRERTTALALRLVELVAEEFSGATAEEKAKLSYWLHSLPTGNANGSGGSWNRYWPASLPRPETADWRKPEGAK